MRLSWQVMCVYVSVDTERYMCVLPIMNTILEKCEHMLNVSAYLPSIPQSDANPTFCDDFSSYLQSNEWKMFMKKQASCTCDWQNVDCLTLGHTFSYCCLVLKYCCLGA